MTYKFAKHTGVQIIWDLVLDVTVGMIIEIYVSFAQRGCFEIFSIIPELAALRPLQVTLISTHIVSYYHALLHLFTLRLSWTLCQPRRLFADLCLCFLLNSSLALLSCIVL